MTQRVINILKAIKVHEHDRGDPAVALRHCECLVESVVQKKAVRQSCEHVEMGEARQALFRLDPFGDIFSDASEAVLRASLVFHGERAIVYPPHRPVYTHDTECLIVSLRARLSSRGVNAATVFFVNGSDERSW